MSQPVISQVPGRTPSRETHRRGVGTLHWFPNSEGDGLQRSPIYRDEHGVVLRGNDRDMNTRYTPTASTTDYLYHMY